MLAKEQIMKTLTMNAIIDRVIEILRDHEYRARNAVHEMWIKDRITSEQDDMICTGISGLFDDAVMMVQQCETPAEIDMVMKRFEVIAQAWIKRNNLPCNF